MSATLQSLDGPESGNAAMVPADPRSRRRGQGAARLRLLAAQVVVFIVFFAIWQLVVELGWLSEFEVSKPTEVLKSLGDLVTEGSLYHNMWLTFLEIVVGLVLGALLGVLVGIVLATRPSLYRILGPMITTLYTLPRIALIGLLIIWFGIGANSKIALVVSLVFFSVLFNTHRGVTLIEARLIDNVRLMGGTRSTIIRQVYLPGTMPWIFAGLRISLVFAVTGAVVGEMLGSQGGLGYMLQFYQSAFDTTGMFAMLVIIAVFSNVLSWLLALAERRLIRWSPSPDAVG